MTSETDYASAVALIGMSGRFPGAGSVSALWDNLLAGVKGLREFSDEELIAAGADPGALADPAYVRIGGSVSGIDQFDIAPFGISPREAETMDPQHRLFLECTWEAIETAGYCPTDLPGHVGVFAGCGFPDYIVKNIQHMFAEPGGMLQIAVGNERDSLASFVSYKLGLTGPSLGVQTFCSTSMIAVHLACQSLLTYECDIALAGGAFLPLPQPGGYRYEPGGITSPDGMVRSFDADANGTVMGSGVGSVALKRMTDALADGDIIHAVILGSAANNDGRARAGYTAPGVDGQAEVIELALGVAGVKPETIGYVECHATATPLGDSIELAAMSRVFTQPGETPAVLGTLKPSLGHLDRASGVAALIRAALSVKHGVLPGTPNYQTPNPALASAADRFRVLTEHQPWPRGRSPRRAGVSSFGLGGTNAHVVLEQAPARPPRAARPGPHLLTFSAADDKALNELTERLRQAIDSAPGGAAADAIDIADVAYTLGVSRGGFAQRRAVVVGDRADAVAALADPSRWLNHKTRRRNPTVSLITPAPNDPTDLSSTTIIAVTTDTTTPETTTPETTTANLTSTKDTAWWSQLQTAIATRAGTGAPGAPGAPATRESATAALASWLTSLGLSVEREAAEPARAAGLGATGIVVAPPAEPGLTAGQWLLDTVARLWLAGCAVDWPALHHGEGRRVELPGYPFQRRRYWVDLKLPAAAAGSPWGETTDTGRGYDRSQWTYLPTWQARPCPVAGLDERVRADGPWLVLAADSRGEALVRQLRRLGADVTAVRPGDRFARTGGDFTVRPASRRDLRELLASLGTPPATIVHGFSLAPSPAGESAAAGFAAGQETGFRSALALAAELVDESGAAPRARLILLTAGAVGVAGSDLTHPEHAALAGLAPTLAQENPRLRCRHIDVDAEIHVRSATGTRPAAARTGDSGPATALLAAALSPHEGPLAIRGGETWLRRYQPFRTDEPDPEADAGVGPIKNGETVLITGGLGDIGLVLARHLAGKYGCKLVLTARSPLPPRREWERFLEQVPKGQQRAARHIRSILDLEQRGAEVLAVAADAADLDQMRAVVDQAVGRFGGIDIAVHAAGVQDGAFFNYAHLLGRAACDAHFAAKVGGFHVLQEVLGDQARDRRITFSSLAAIIGGITLGPYAAANAALDAYARQARMTGAGRWITVDWDTWNIDPARMAGHGPGVTDFAMVPAEALDIFERALAAGDQVGQLVISTGSLAARVEQWVTRDLHEDVAAATAGDGERHPRPDLGTPYQAPAPGPETILAEVWSSVLGIEPIGVHDNFYELGGHSLVAMSLTAQIRKAMDVAIPIAGLLENPTIRQLADLLAAGDPRPQPATAPTGEDE